MGVDKTEEVKKLLRERFDNDNIGVGKLDYVSWELGFQRGMEYQQELDKRVLDLTESAGKMIKNFVGRFGGGE